MIGEVLRFQEEQDQTFLESIKGLSVKCLIVGTDCPGNEDRQLALGIEDGEIKEATVSHKPAPSDLRTAQFEHTKYPFRVQAQQQTFVDVMNGRL